MGRTNPTYRDFLRGFEEDCAPFRRALRRRHKPAFDALFERAETHADAAGHLNAADPRIAFLLSVALAQERELRALRAEIDADRG